MDAGLQLLLTSASQDRVSQSEVESAKWAVAKALERREKLEGAKWELERVSVGLKARASRVQSAVKSEVGKYSGVRTQRGMEMALVGEQKQALDCKVERLNGLGLQRKSLASEWRAECSGAQGKKQVLVGRMEGCGPRTQSTDAKRLASSEGLRRSKALRLESEGKKSREVELGCSAGKTWEEREGVRRQWVEWTVQSGDKQRRAREALVEWKEQSGNLSEALEVAKQKRANKEIGLRLEWKARVESVGATMAERRAERERMRGLEKGEWEARKANERRLQSERAKETSVGLEVGVCKAKWQSEELCLSAVQMERTESGLARSALALFAQNKGLKDRVLESKGRVRGLLEREREEREGRLAEWASFLAKREWSASNGTRLASLGQTHHCLAIELNQLRARLQSKRSQLASAQMVAKQRQAKRQSMQTALAAAKQRAQSQERELTACLQRKMQAKQRTKAEKQRVSQRMESVRKRVRAWEERALDRQKHADLESLKAHKHLAKHIRALEKDISRKKLKSRLHK